jgi:hypothetical protein
MQLTVDANYTADGKPTAAIEEDGVLVTPVKLTSAESIQSALDAMLVKNGVETATIATEASISNEIDLGDKVFAGLIMPDAWTTAVITFLVAKESGGTFYSLYNDGGTEISLTAAAGTAVGIADVALALAPWRYVKLRSGTASAPVAQEADRVINLVLKS